MSTETLADQTLAQLLVYLFLQRRFLWRTVSDCCFHAAVLILRGARGGSLQFDELISTLRETVSQFPDKRVGTNTRYLMADFALSAFSVFFMQCPSFLDFQRTIGRSKGLHNAASLFGVTEVPSDNQIRTMLDAVGPESL